MQATLDPTPAAPVRRRALPPAPRLDAELQTATAVVELLEQLAASADLAQAAERLVNELRRYLDCQRVVLGLRRRGGCRLLAVSDQARFDRRGEFARAAEAAGDEVLLRGAATTWPPQNAADRHATCAHQHLCTVAGAAAVVSAPLRPPGGEPVGVVTCLGVAAQVQTPRTTQLLAVSEQPVGACLQLLQRAEGSRFAKPLRQWQRRGGRWAKLATLALAGLLLAALALPVPYRIRCPVQLQPVSRRFVATPFQGTLERVLVAPGDLVAAGQLLARLDGREISWELESLSAEQSRVAKKRDAALASHRTTEAQLARLEMARLANQRQLWEHRLQHLEIRSPIAGLVVSGDVEKAEGAPVTVGQTLFEIAPLDQMVVEVAVPESEIAHVTPGQPVEVWLTAYPQRPWEGRLARIHPRAELRDAQNVFIAEVPLDNAESLLRPGMKGDARIVGPRRALAWTLGHRPWDRLRLAWGW